MSSIQKLLYSKLQKKSVLEFLPCGSHSIEINLIEYHIHRIMGGRSALHASLSEFYGPSLE